MTNPIDQWRDDRAEAYAAFVGSVRAIADMLHENFISKEKAVEQLRSAELRRVDAFKLADDRFHATNCSGGA